MPDLEMYEAATLLGMDTDTNVEYAIYAQAEVVLGPNVDELSSPASAGILPF